ncbi:glycosyl hydrolase-related protein [Bacteroidota bacterium]
MKMYLWIFSLLLIFQCGYSQPKKIYIAPDCHTDYYWTADSGSYTEAFLEMLDYYIDLNESTANDPYYLQSKWNCDGTYWVHTYRKHRSSEQFQKLIKQIREGRITVPLNTLNSVHGVAPAEAAIRDMYYAGRLEREYDLDFDLAFNMEDHVMPLGLASIWAGAGAKYSWHGVCGCATKVEGLYNRPYEFYHYTGLDGRSVLMKWQSLTTDKKYNKGYSNQFPGGYAEAWDPESTILYYKELMESEDYPYNIAAAFGAGWDKLKITSDAFVNLARQYSDADFQVIVSNEIDFLSEMNSTYGNNLPAITLSYGGSEWGKGVASLAEVSARVKRSIEKLRSAEALFTLASLKNPAFGTGLETMRENAWISCGLYFEHDWTADSPVVSKKTRAAWHRKTEKELSNYVDTLYQLSLVELFGNTSQTNSKENAFFVFNPLGWQRTDVADYPYDGPGDIEVREISNGESVPHQHVVIDQNHFIRIIAKDIPALGFRKFRIQPASKNPEEKNPIQITGNTLKSKFYQLTIANNGSITSFIEKASGKEFVRSIDGVFANDLNAVSQYSDTNFNLINTGPVSATIRTSSKNSISHNTTITIYSFQDRIDIENELIHKFDATPLSYGFSFDFSEFDIWHEEVGAILNAKPYSQGGHYADTHSRLDWLTLNHYVSLADKNGSVTISNLDAYFMKVGNSTVHELDNRLAQIHILAAGQIDADNNLGFENQDGDTLIKNHFALRASSDSYDPAKAMKFSLEHQNPLITGKLADESLLFEESTSFIEIPDPDILVWTVKPSEEGINNGVILRVWNMKNEATDFTIHISAPVSKCYYASHIETNEKECHTENGRVVASIGPNAIQTFRLFLAK